MGFATVSRFARLASGPASEMRLRSDVLAIALVAAATVACGERDDGLRARRVEREALIELLVVEEDGVRASQYGPVPMTSEHRGDPDNDTYYQEPPSEFCEDGEQAGLLAPDSYYAYLGDGGDYLYIDHWVSGERLEDAARRFDQGVAAIEGCSDLASAAVQFDHAGVDQVRRYEAPDGPGGFVYARNGGVIVLLGVNVLNEQRYDDADVDHLIDVALNKLADIGPVEIVG